MSVALLTRLLDEPTILEWCTQEYTHCQRGGIVVQMPGFLSLWSHLIAKTFKDEPWNEATATSVMAVVKGLLDRYLGITHPQTVEMFQEHVVNQVRVLMSLWTARSSDHASS